MIAELDLAVLAVEVPEHGLKAGDVGTVVLVHDTRGYEVEFTTLDGTTIAVVSLSTDQVRSAHSGEIAHVRSVEAA